MGQVINVPVDVNNMITLLPRELDDFSFNVHIRRNLIHESTCLEGIVKKKRYDKTLAGLFDQHSVVHFQLMYKGNKLNKTKLRSFGPQAN
jgi:hypothetical protein